MAQPVYSTQFIASPTFLGTYDFIVPTGFVAVVRDLDIVLQPTGSAVLQLFVNGCGIWIAETGFQPGFSYWSWRGRQVCTSPGAVRAVLSDNGSVVVSGYLLSLP